MKPAIGYIRVSTARQGRSGLGLEAQQAALAKFCDAEAFKLVETYTETESGEVLRLSPYTKLNFLLTRS